MCCAQETYYELLLAGQFISEEEREVLRWGRNAKVTVPQRFKASGKHGETYKHATAVECLVRLGFVHGFSAGGSFVLACT